MKYIVLETVDGSVKKLVPIIFPDFMTHLDMAAHAQLILETQHKVKYQIRSAGSINLIVESCHGSSESLHVESDRGNDKEMINSYDYLHGIVYYTEKDK